MFRYHRFMHNCVVFPKDPGVLLEDPVNNINQQYPIGHRTFILKDGSTNWRSEPRRITAPSACRTGVRRKL